MTTIMYAPAALGDAIVCVGIIKHFAKKGLVIVPCNDNLYPSVVGLHKSNKNVWVIKHREGWDDFIDYSTVNRIEDAYFAMYKEDSKVYLWDQQMYTQAGVPFYKRYKNFSLESSDKTRALKKRLTGDEKYILTHRTTSQHKEIIPIDLNSWRTTETEYKIIEISPEITNDITDYYDLILGASEIHCVPSSLYCLVDGLLDKIEGNAFLHDIRKDTKMMYNHKWNNWGWNLITYSSKV